MTDKVKIFKYNYGNCHYYGQGFEEFEVRIALETKLNLPHGTLSVGNDNLSINEVKKVTLSKVNISDLRLKLPQIKRLNLDDTINDIIDNNPYVKNNINLFYQEISSIYNIPYHYMLMIDKDYTIKDILGLTNYKIIVKTHKIIKDPYSNNVRIVSRVDEIKNQIRKLNKLDYSLFFETADLDGEYERLVSAYNKALEHDENPRGFKNEKNREILDNYPLKISEVKDLIIQSENRINNTGYYVNGSSQYHHSTYDEVLAEFDKIYDKIKTKVIRYSFSDIPMNPDSEVTILDCLDSYQLVSRQVNANLKIKK